MIIAIPVLEDKGEESQISQHFGHNPLFAIYNSETQELKIVNIGAHGTGCTPVEEIKKHNADTVYVIGIGSRAMSLLNTMSVNLKTGSFKTVGEVITNLDKLQDLEEGCGH